jgi:MFS family permease
MSSSGLAGEVRRARRTETAVFLVHGLLFASWAAHIPHVKARLDMSDGTLGLALLGTPVGSVLAMVLAARLLPRLGSRRMVQASLAGYCLSSPLVGLAGSVPALVAALFVWGAFQGTLDVSMNTQAIAVEGVADQPLMNGLHAAWSIGAFAGAAIGALGVAAGVSLSSQLAVLGLAALLGLGPSTAALLGDSDDWAAAGPPDAAASAEPADRVRPWSTVLVVLGAVAFASMLCEGAAADWASVYLRDGLGAGVGVAGLGYTAFTLAMTGTRLGGNAMLRRVRRERLLPALALLATAGFAVALLVRTVPATLAGFLCLGAGLATVVPTTFSAAGDVAGLHPGVSVATVSAFGWAGFVCGPPLIGQLAGRFSLHAALWLLPVLTGLVAVLTGRRAGRGAT